ncbi:MAG: glucokinase [Ignavibacteriales bacterium]|nr:MAG: glucokinase [Ignavibacteriaceae bacterium]MBW7872791.1 glucokinase [Ignavibacteria bacterium]MCZ2143511.1 glucokinase [Ignavibacteriales bacterium]OQY74130.1 MAG: glucokinase [Ignavibacteriales bacterium UTCHB3]MBV6444387.1 Glucokinase [Ignavibacteriaceae bacterium]
MILACDAGGTKTVLSVFSLKNKKLTEHKSERYVSGDFEDLEDIINAFLSDSDFKIEAGCAGVPGPVVNGKSASTNLTWDMSEKRIAQKTGIEKFRLVNDLYALAAAVPFLESDDVLTVYPGKSSGGKGVKAILAPGTGLGHGFLVPLGEEKYRIIPSEAGHADFAPVDDLQIELLKYMAAEYGRVSIERVASGLGLRSIFKFLHETGAAKATTEFLAEIKTEDPGATISKYALSGKDELAVMALDLFTRILGQQAGNLVLTTMATGGVYLGGGIPPKIAKKITDGAFVDAYLAKGRLSYIVENTPVYLIKDSNAGLHGSAYIAAGLI